MYSIIAWVCENLKWPPGIAILAFSDHVYASYNDAKVVFLSVFTLGAINLFFLHSY